MKTKALLMALLALVGLNTAKALDNTPKATTAKNPTDKQQVGAAAGCGCAHCAGLEQTREG